jgi:malate dehydrogenase (oxaloacetate-decarboxylating)
VLSRTRLMTPALLVAAVKALASSAPALNGTGAGLLPDVEDVREISVQIAKSVIKKAVEDGLAQNESIPTNDADLEIWIREQMWDAEYRPLQLVEESKASAHAKGEAGTASGQRAARSEH